MSNYVHRYFSDSAKPEAFHANYRNHFILAIYRTLFLSIVARFGLPPLVLEKVYEGPQARLQERMPADNRQKIFQAQASVLDVQIVEFVQSEEDLSRKGGSG